jgi:hypothetical protein
MRIVRTAAIAALLSCSLVTPAYAANAVPIQDTSGQYQTPQQLCDAVLRPAAPSGFVTEPVNISDSGLVNDGAAYQGSAIGDPYGVGATRYENFFLTEGFYRNGGSPNVWGGGRVDKIWADTAQMFNMLQNKKRTLTFGCKVTKDPADGPNDPNTGLPRGPDEIMPPGLQTTGNSMVEIVTGAPADPPTKEFLLGQEFREPGIVAYGLICISPNNVTRGKPGTWTGKHGFLAENCQAASDAANQWIPSGNAPVL